MSTWTWRSRLPRPWPATSPDSQRRDPHHAGPVILLQHGTNAFDIGGDYGSPFSSDYQALFVFTGKLDYIMIDLR